MTTTKKSLALVLGVAIALTPFVALAQDVSVNADTSAGVSVPGAKVKVAVTPAGFVRHF